MRLYNIHEYTNASTAAIIDKIGEELEELKAELIIVPLHQNRIMEESADVLQACYTLAMHLDTYVISKPIIFDSGALKQFEHIEKLYIKLKECEEYVDNTFIINYLRSLYSAMFSLTLKLKITDWEMSEYLYFKFKERGLL